MRSFLWVVAAVNGIVLLYFLALDLRRYYASAFELRQNKDRLLKLINKYHQDLLALQKVDLVVLLVSLTGLLVYLEESLTGVGYALGATIGLYMIAKLSLVKYAARYLFELHYESVCKLARVLHPILKYIAVSLPSASSVQSREEFIDRLQGLPSTVLVPLERQRVELLLNASQKTVKDIMTPKRRVVMVEPASTLGPVVLSDLQKSGHGYFPVATKKGEPEGILDLNDLSDIQQAKQRSQVREVMSHQVSWVEETTSLYELAEAFLVEKQYLLLVRNSEGMFSGVVTVADLMKHLVGVIKD